MLVRPHLRTLAIVAIDMGYGHLRPAHALAAEIRSDVLEVDRPPLADLEEQELWARVRRFYEALSRSSQRPIVGALSRRLLDEITAIPHLHPLRDLSAPNGGVRALDWMITRGLGRGLAAHLERSGQPLLTTFYAPAVMADRLGRGPVHCLVTDSDINRVWVPRDPRRSRVQYFAPSRRVVRRLESYGVRAEQIVYSGFPLPGELLGGRERAALRRNLAARLVRLDPTRAFIGPNRAEIEHKLGPLPVDDRPPLVTFAVGGAGAQAELADQFLPSLRAPILAGKLRLALVAGVRPAIAARFRTAVNRLELPDVRILLELELPAYLAAFNALLAETDVLWTKSSEITFFAALGLPLVFSRPMGVHEEYNRRWAIEAGAGLVQGDPRHAAGWLSDWISDGTLAAAAWSGATRLPSLGLYDIADAVLGAGRTVY
jgi:UDP-N-acetylglucosamine:LPS N-acetylglucosamine transferase